MQLSASGSQPRLAGHVVQVWMAQLNASEARFDQCHSWLSADEKARTARFRFDQHRRAFILGRGVMRGLLSGFLEMPPERIEFCYGPNGKPALTDSARPLRFK